MGTTPATDNVVADFMNGLINALMTGGEKAAEAYITALDPVVLANPFISYLVDEAVEYIGSLMDAMLAKGATALVIDIQTNGENSAAVRAATALQFAIASGDANAIQKATTAAAASYADLVHWDGSTVPAVSSGI